MTQLEVLYRYEMHPTETAMAGVGAMRQVYGVRKIVFDESAKTVRVEYDATRLNDATIAQLLRRTGIDIVEEIPLALPKPPAAEEPAAAAK
jgi:copper chaperone CopZ